MYNTRCSDKFCGGRKYRVDISTQQRNLGSVGIKGPDKLCVEQQSHKALLHRKVKTFTFVNSSSSHITEYDTEIITLK